MKQVWTYRYGPNGVREQRRLMMSPLHDSAGCTGVLPWTYYVNDPSGLVLAVYHGRQMKRSQLGDGCPTYGPDGVNVVYERENYGANAGQWVKRYLTTDYQGTVLQAHDVNGDHVQHYELFGADKGQVARRTGWLDREIDWESSPLTDLYRTVDLVNRKYDPQRGVFLTSDPLWMMSADASSYHYAYHDPMNMIDPWGLDGQKEKGVGEWPPDGAGPGVRPSKPRASDITPFDHSFSFWMDGARGDYLHSVGEGALPGAGIGGGGLGPLGGSNGGTGKTDPPASSSEKWAGVPYGPNVSKWDVTQPWIDVARSQIGVKENRSPTVHSPDVMKYHKSYPGGPNNDDDETGRWCGSFVYWCLKQCGIQGVLPNPAGSQNWKEWGQNVMLGQTGRVSLSSVPYGSIVVFKGASISHIAFAVGRSPNGNRILCLGGNQGHQVKESWFSSADIVAVRYPVGFVVSQYIPVVATTAIQTSPSVR